MEGLINNPHNLLDEALERSIPHITNLTYIKEIILLIKDQQFESFTEVSGYLDNMILKEQDPTKCTDLKIIQMSLTRSQK